MAKMPSRLKVDHFPANGRPEKASERAGTGKSLFSSNSTKGVGYKKGKVSVADKGIGFATAKPGAKVTKAAGMHMPEEGARSRPGGQYSAGGKGGTPKADKGTNAAHSPGTGASHERGNVPRGEHYHSSHREPRSHEEFHRLGSGHWK
jgi:hypothetical protein